MAVSDLFPDRCAALAKRCRCKKTYPSLEEMVKDDSIEAIFCSTDAPSHARHAMLVMRHGKDVCVNVPAVWGSLEDADKLQETVKETGQKYMMFETSWYRPDCYQMRMLYQAGALGKVYYSEGEYCHYRASKTPIPSYKDWRKGMPPLWYATHSTAYHTGVTGGHFTSVSASGVPGYHAYYNDNQYNNRFASEYGIFTTDDGAVSRMMVTSAERRPYTEAGRVAGRQGSYLNGKYWGLTPKEKLPDLSMPPLPPSVQAGGHGGSHGQLSNEFINAILEDRTPEIDIIKSLAMTVPGIIAHQSALKDGENMEIPQYILSQ